MELEYPLHIALIPVAIAAVGVLAGVFLFFKVNRFLGHVVGAFGVLFGLIFGPMLLMDRVVIDDRQIRQSTGWWFDQTHKGFGLDGIKRVIITTDRDLKGRPIQVWIAEYADRQSVQIDPGDLWESNGDTIVQHLNGLGIVVVRADE